MITPRKCLADLIVTAMPSSSRLRTLKNTLIEWDARGRIVSLEEFSLAKRRVQSKRWLRAKLLTPGLIDCHTHAVHAGNRVHEWLLRLQGESYQDIKRKGGGIAFTVKATQRAEPPELLETSLSWAHRTLSMGITTAEVKSGYGLSLKDEKKILQVIAQLRRKAPIDIVPTFMGAHSIPAGHTEESYSRYLIDEVLPEVAPLAHFQDIFCEEGYFSHSWGKKILMAGARLGLKPKVHAHEFARSGGVQLAADCSAISAEHLMILNDHDIELLRRKRIIAVVLPGTSFFLGARKFAPARKLLDAGVRIAIASDFNPGTNPSSHLPLCGTFSAIFQGLLPEEIFKAQTWHAALALGLKDRGILVPKARADCVAWDLNRFEEIYYRYGESRVAFTVVGGKLRSQ